MQITRQSLLSGKTHTLEIPVTSEQLDNWKAGAAIQNVMPELDPDLREFIMTGITAEEWLEMPEV
jgi:hypothetical protein